MRFLVDMPVTPDAVAYLRAAGHDAVHASSVGLAQATDHEIIEMARRAGRVVVTADLDYPRLVLLSDAAGPGIILFRGGSYSDSEMLALPARPDTCPSARSTASSHGSTARRGCRPLPFPSAVASAKTGSCSPQTRTRSA